MNNTKTLVFFGAHPDDESFGVGATLAQYAASGVKVYYVCSTGGELGTVDQKYLQEHDTIEQLRVAELKCAADVLGLAGVFYLGYRDSGMRGSADNQHPDSLAMASLEEAAGRAVKIIREIKPDVVITHDAGGGYGHPDHVATHNATVEAFYAAGNPERYPEAGPVFQPGKLYFGVRSFRLMKFMVRLMPLFGQDPHHFGRNKDIDITDMSRVEYPVHAVIRIKKQSIEIRNKAVACHASQSSGRSRPGLFKALEIIGKFSGPKDYFMRAYPRPTRRREKDLFEGII
jgi:N-acetyl-1-D-myo-inositol-2-amino-2-deoxy-alpha-D-glucopyranoside deacetylase/mycothiol S-conjugate amidase